MKHYWTRDEVRELRQLVDERTPVVEIARALGRSVSSTQCKMTALRIGAGRTGRPRDAARTAAIIDLICKLGTIAAVVRAMRPACYNSVRKIVNRLVAEGVLKRVGGRYAAGADWY